MEKIEPTICTFSDGDYSLIINGRVRARCEWRDDADLILAALQLAEASRQGDYGAEEKAYNAYCDGCKKLPSPESCVADAELEAEQ